MLVLMVQNLKPVKNQQNDLIHQSSNGKVRVLKILLRIKTLLGKIHNKTKTLIKASHSRTSAKNLSQKVKVLNDLAGTSHNQAPINQN